MVLVDLVTDCIATGTGTVSTVSVDISFVHSPRDISFCFGSSDPHV